MSQRAEESLVLLFPDPSQKIALVCRWWSVWAFHELVPPANKIP